MTAAEMRVLPVPVAISKRNRSLPSLTARSEGGNGFHLIGPQEAQAVCLNEADRARPYSPMRPRRHSRDVEKGRYNQPQRLPR